MSGKSCRIEWIGVRNLMSDDQLSFAKIAGRLGPYGEATVEAVDIILAPLVRTDGDRQRIMGPESGLSESYVWGLQPASYIQPMRPGDAAKLLAGPNGSEFRHEGDLSRVPVVPERVLTKVVRGIIEAVQTGKPFYTNEPAVFTDAEGLLKQYERVKERRAEIGEVAAWNARRSGLDAGAMRVRHGRL